VITLPIHPIINSSTLKRIFDEHKDSFQTIPLRDYLKMGLKPRGTGDGTLNSHDETVIVYNESLTVKKLSDVTTADKLLAINSLGNKFQNIDAVVQGFNPNDPKPAFERPVLREGPHMVIGLYAYHQHELHLFRTLQLRNNRLVVDTPRGFAESKMLENGEQLYDADFDQVTKNLVKIVKEEAGNLKIKQIRFRGADICNSSCIVSKSALYAVEIDYESFINLSMVISPEEAKRRAEQFQHEGLIGKLFDFTIDEYMYYRSDANITKDMTADYISDYLVMENFARLF
jgi:hypothetical protein